MTFALPLLALPDALRVEGDSEADTAGMDDNWRAVMAAAGEMNGDTLSGSSSWTKNGSSFTGTQP